MKFRRHADSNSPSNEKSREIRAELARTFADIAGELIDNKDRLELPDDVVSTLNKTKVVNQKRVEYISRRNVLGVISLITKLDCYTRFKAWAGDLVCLF